MKTETRKADHLNICLKNNVEIGSAGFSDVILLHNALSGVDLNKAETEVRFLNKKFSFPLMISSMTGGHNRSYKINTVLAEAAEKFNITFALGSQRAMLENRKSVSTYRIRHLAPDVFLIGNLGVTNLSEYKKSDFEWLINETGIDALCIHLNPVQEACQLEGNTDFSDSMEMIENVCRDVGIPVIAKEVGNGISQFVAKKLEDAGIEAVDVAGFGGTSWPLVESYRKGLSSFSEWGIPTAVSVILCSHELDVSVVSSGGVRSGIDIAKSMALGADMTGMALPILKQAMKGRKSLFEFMEQKKKELKIAMFATGCKNMKELAKARVIITGRTREWIELYGISTESYAKR